MRFKLNILASADGVQMPYRPIDLTFRRDDTPTEHALLYALFAALLMLFALGLVAILLLFRYKRSQARLHYELTDVRNVAGIELQDLRDPGAPLSS